MYEEKSAEPPFDLICGIGVCLLRWLTSIDQSIDQSIKLKKELNLSNPQKETPLLNHRLFIYPSTFTFIIFLVGIESQVCFRQYILQILKMV